MLKKFKQELKQKANSKQAEIYQRFFKTEKGEYGEGDIFFGIKLPELRKISKKYDLELKQLQNLLDSKIHEHRMSALFILTKKYRKSDNKTKKEIVNFYIKNFENINNWDLVDISAPHILGDYLLDKESERKILYNFAKSNHLWTKRISIVATHQFIRNNDFDDTLKISEMLLNDNHDLIHKATGWMLREVGKRNQQLLEKFLKKHNKVMPRTMLRYSIEKFDKDKRKFYMKK